VLDVSVDWLLGRTNLMDLLEMPDLQEREPPKKKARKANAQ
jgi:hypothetical protein